jgi:hypothetical protein
MVVGNASSVALNVLASAVPNSMVIAFENNISSHIQSEYVNFYFTTAILGFRLNGMSNNVGVSTFEKFDPVNMGIAAGTLFLTALELEIHLEEILPP